MENPGPTSPSSTPDAAAEPPADVVVVASVVLLLEDEPPPPHAVAPRATVAPSRMTAMVVLRIIRFPLHWTSLIYASALEIGFGQRSNSAAWPWPPPTHSVARP